MSKEWVRVLRVRIGRCLAGPPSMMTSQSSPTSARLSRRWRCDPSISPRPGTDLQAQTRESSPGAGTVRALYALSTERNFVGFESISEILTWAPASRK
jgi:hypothetical protein